GCNVIIEQLYGGYKIMKGEWCHPCKVYLMNKFKNLGAHLIQDVVQKTNKMADDRMITATILAGAIYVEGVKNIVAGWNPIHLPHSSQAAVNHVLSFLSANTKIINTPAKIAQVTTISMKGDIHVQNLISQATEKVSREG
ncbi:hypothetical protein PILCRDRAFT_33439, partial [Piloderma croceum F 1598]